MTDFKKIADAARSAALEARRQAAAVARDPAGASPVRAGSGIAACESNKKQVEELVKLATGGCINAYTNEAAARKTRFMELCRLALKDLAGELGLAPGQCEIRGNRAGIACSGEVVLHSDHIYVCLEQSSFFFYWYWRTCQGRKDYKGGINQWAKWEKLLDLPELAATMNARRGTR